MVDEDGRKTEQAFDWVEKTIGGTIVHKERQPRWRPQWFLDVKKPNGEVLPLMMRGWRPPLAEDEHVSRERLRAEGQLTGALYDSGIAVAQYYGFEPDGGWALMSRLEGSPHIGDVTDLSVQSKIFREYMEHLAKMHSLDPAKVALPEGTRVSRDYDDGISWALNMYLAPYRSVADRDPEPLIELGLKFAATYPPKPVERFSICTGDPGINNFMFKGDKFEAIFDIELGFVGDPLLEMMQMRLKTMAHGTEEGYLRDLPGHISHWAKTLGLELDRQSTSYWTVVGMLQAPLFMAPQLKRPDPALVAEMAHARCFVAVYRRGLAEALAEYYDIPLTPPTRPEPVENGMSRWCELVTKQLRETHMPAIEGHQSFLLGATATFAEAAHLYNLIGPEVDARNREDMATILGYLPATQFEGLAAIEAKIHENFERDIEKVVLVLYAIEARNEWFAQPMQKWSKYRTGGMMERLW